MERRSFLRNTAALTALSLVSATGLARTLRPSNRFPGRILPRSLKKGDLIGLVTPGSAVSEEQLHGTVEKLEKLGFRTTYEDTVLSSYGYFAGEDDERARELMNMFKRKDVDGIWCVRGGYGSIRILDLLDYTAIRENPKVFFGFSDITALLNAIYQRSGLVTFHGPVGISSFNKFALKSIRKVIMDPSESYKYPYKREKDSKNFPEYERYTITGGKAEGILVGGNISVLDSIIGTYHEPDFRNKLVFLEEIEEKTYRVDKMLYHLLSATNLKDASGIVMGVMGDCNTTDEPSLPLKTALSDLLSPLGIPVSYGLSFGHIDRNTTLPLGIRAAFDADKNSLELLEAAVI